MKILLSPGYGAGWSTWMDDKVKKDALTYQPIIEFIEGGGGFNRNETSLDWKHNEVVLDGLHYLLKQFYQDMVEKHGDVHIYLGGACGLIVTEAYGQVKIREYDGSESIDCRDSDGWIDLG